MKMEHSVPKRRHIKFRVREIAQKKEYKIQNMATIFTSTIIMGYFCSRRSLHFLRNLLWCSVRLVCDMCEMYALDLR